jgi:hypothetical protein
MMLEERGRCERCGWPLADNPKEGCIPGNCSMRPLPPLRFFPEPLPSYQERVDNKDCEE